MKKLLFIFLLIPVFISAQDKKKFVTVGANLWLINYVTNDSLQVNIPVQAGQSGKVLSTNGYAAEWIAAGGGGSGITTLNTLTGATQTFATGTSGTDFAISSSGTAHTFNIPDASITNRGLITTGAQSILGAKTLTNTLTLGNGSGVAGRLELYRSSSSAAGYFYMSGNDIFIENASANIQLKPGGLSNVFGVNGTSGNLILSTTGVLTDNTTAILTMNSTTKGLLIPRMTTTQMNAISSPSTGLKIYNTTDNADYIYNGTSWGSQLIVSGTYTPTLTNTTNVGASTAYSCQYMRVGNTVTVSGQIDIDPTLTASSTVLGIALPIASAIANSNELGGTAYSPTIAAMGAALLGDATNDRATLQFMSSDINNQALYFTFTYRIL